MGQGRDQAKTYLKENPAVALELRRKILELNKIGVITAASMVEAEAKENGDTDVKSALAKATDDKKATVPAAVSAKANGAAGKATTAAAPPKKH